MQVAFNYGVEFHMFSSINCGSSTGFQVSSHAPNLVVSGLATVNSINSVNICEKFMCKVNPSIPETDSGSSVRLLIKINN